MSILIAEIKRKYDELGELIKVLSNEKKIDDINLNWIPLFVNIMNDNYGISMADIISKDKCEPIIQCRQIYVFFRHKIDKKAKTRIGKEIGRDHSTIVSTIKTVEKYIESNDEKFMKVYWNFEHLNILS